LDYYTNSGLTYFYGPTTITNSKNKNSIYSERGFYNTKTDISHFVKNAKLFLKWEAKKNLKDMCLSAWTYKKNII